MRKAPKKTASASASESMQTVTNSEVITRYYKADTEKPIITAIGIGVAKSYDNSLIAAARKVRKGCYFCEVIDGIKGDERHAESVRKAYDMLSIDYAGHIPFRGRLRKEENATGLMLTKGDRKFFFRDAERMLPEEKAVPIAPIAPIAPILEEAI